MASNRSLDRAYREARKGLDALGRLSETWVTATISPQKGAQRFRETFDPLVRSVARLQQCYPQAQRELASARARGDLRDIVAACGRSGVFAIDVALKLLQSVVRVVQPAARGGVSRQNVSLCMEAVSACDVDAAALRRLASLVEAEYIDAGDNANRKRRGSGKKRNGKPGPKGPHYNAEGDRRIFDGWETWKRAGGERSYEAYATEKYGATTRKQIKAIEKAIERHRKRQRRKGQK